MPSLKIPQLILLYHSNTTPPPGRTSYAERTSEAFEVPQAGLSTPGGSSIAGVVIVNALFASGGRAWAILQTGTAHRGDGRRSVPVPNLEGEAAAR
jgi:hypothetical protein